MTRGVVLGAVLATGAIMLIPGVAQAVGRAGRPLARAAMRTGTVAYDEFRKAGAEAWEHMEDIAAEIREEMERERHAAAEAAAAGAGMGAGAGAGATAGAATGSRAPSGAGPAPDPGAARGPDAAPDGDD